MAFLDSSLSGFLTVSFQLQLAVGFILLSGIALILYRLFLHPLSKVPGPFLARITELWRSARYFNRTWFDDILELHRRYGPVVRIAPNEVSVVSPDLVKTIYSHQKGTLKTDWYDVWGALGGKNNDSKSIFNVRDPKYHGFLRKRVAAIYSMSTIMSMEPKIQMVMNLLWQRFDEFAEKQQAFNLTRWASYFTYDVVGTLCLSEMMGFIREGRDPTDFISGIHGAFYWVANLGYLPFQANLVLNPVVRYIDRSFNLKISEHMGTFLTLSVDKIVARMKKKNTGDSGDANADMLDHFLAMKTLQGGPPTMPEILGEVGNVLAAGADTTSVAIKAILGPLIRDPCRYRRLQAELDDAVKACGIATEEPIPYSAIKELPYLGACIKEGSRLHPSIIYQLPREAPPEGIELEGYFLGPTTTISMSPLAQNRCKAIFGDDADEWKPERWMVDEINSEEQVKLMDKILATFGYGSRTCIGRNLAMFEVTKFVAQILTRYDIELLNPARPWFVHSQWFAEVDNLMIRLRKRKSKSYVAVAQ